MNAGRTMFANAWAVGVLLLLALTSVPRAQDVERVQLAQTESDGIIREARKLSAETAPSSGVDQLLVRVHYQIGEDSVETRVRRVVRFGSQEAIQAEADHSIVFDGFSDRLEIRQAASVSPDGSVRWLTEKDLEVDDYPDDYQVYTDSKIVSLLYPALQEGSLTVIDYVLVTDLRSSEHLWSEDVFLQSEYPRHRLEVSAAWAPDLAVQWTRDLPFLSCEEGMRSVACRGEDIPAPVIEAGVDWYDELPAFVITVAQDWSDVVKRARDAFDSALTQREQIGPLARSLTSESDGEEEAFAALFDHVARGVRYVSRSTAGNLITPHAVDDTATSRYGDCKDKSALLVALLQEAGTRAWPVLVSTERSKLTSAPLAGMHYFDHMIVCARLRGEVRCVDPTDAYTDPEHLTASVQGAMALPLLPGAQLQLLPASTYRWRLEVDTELRFDEKGGQHERQVRRYLGEYAGLMRAGYAPMDVKERQRHAEESYADVVSSMGEPTFTFEGLGDLSPTLVVSSENHFEELVATGEDIFYTEPSVWIRSELASVYPEQESYGTSFPGLQVTARYRLDYGGSWRHRFAGPVLDLQHRFGSFKQSVEQHDDHIEFTSTLYVPARELAVQEMESFREFMNLFYKQAKLRVYAKSRQ
ncbi:MAG: DUF3857 domain-containing protein [Pseudomonadota bacterium]